MDLYLVAVILAPTEKEVYEDGATHTVVVQPQAVLAKDESHAAMQAMRFVPEEHEKKGARLEVRVLPFGRVAR